MDKHPIQSRVKSCSQNIMLGLVAKCDRLRKKVFISTSSWNPPKEKEWKWHKPQGQGNVRKDERYKYTVWKWNEDEELEMLEKTNIMSCKRGCQQRAPQSTVQHPQKDAGTGGISLQGRWGWGVGLKTLIQQILGIAMLDFCFHGAWILGGERDYESAKKQGILNSDKSAGGKWE